MKETSIIKLSVLIFALFANINYLLFILNPYHIGNLPFFVLTTIADLIVIITFLSIWGTAVYFEIFKSRYYNRTDSLRKKYKNLKNKSVAILVPVVNEDFDIIKKNLENIKNFKGNFSIYLLDESKRYELEKYCLIHDINYVNRDDRKHFKAGNLNNALKYITAEFIAVIDADFYLSKDFLEKTLPIFGDPTIGIVQTPQSYYNKDSFFSRGSQAFQKIFYTFILPGKNLVNSAYCVGTNVIYRKEVLDKIGGFPKMNHSEDIFTSINFLELGYTTYYLDEIFGEGLAPNNLVSFFNQQLRWARGGFTMFFTKNTIFNKKLNIDQKIQFFMSNFYYFLGISVIIYLVSPFINLYFNILPIKEAYFSQWIIDYIFLFVANFLAIQLFIRKNLLEAFTLGFISFVPYFLALFVTLFNINTDWKPTNQKYSALIARILSPVIFYFFISFASFYLFFTRSFNLYFTGYFYLFWLIINNIFILYIIYISYFLDIFRD